MATLHINNLPESVVDELRRRAEHFHRPVEDEAASVLTQFVTHEGWRSDLSARDLGVRAKRVREGHREAWVTEEFLRMAKNDGRA